MAYEVKSHEAAHNVVIESRQKLSVTGVEDVESFDESSIIVYTAKGVLVVKGEGLHIGRLSLDGGELSVEGMIDSLHYENDSRSGGFWSRLFG